MSPPAPPQADRPTPVNGALVWLRRDLRTEDHAALSTALRSARQVWCVFVLDTDILDPLPRVDRRVRFILDSLVQVDRELRRLAAQAGVENAEAVRLIVRHGRPVAEIPALAAALGVQRVISAHDDEPTALARDAAVSQQLAALRIESISVKDHVVRERREVLTQSGSPYGVFTPYKNMWLKTLEPHHLAEHPVAPHAAALAPVPQSVLSSWPEGGSDPAVPAWLPTAAAIGFDDGDASRMRTPAGPDGARALLDDFLTRIDAYGEARDFPAVKGPSYLSVHLRFGTVSVRRLAREAHARSQAGSSGATVWLNELIWRDFYHQILHHHPRVGQGQAFRAEYDRIAWAMGPEAEAAFSAWCEGRTGYPIVDAAMRQLNQTGYMHNRLRMVTASFLMKDLGIDWRRGEAYFATHLNDFDLAANNGGWQWASSSGCDAQPYFRIFNPVSQSQKFDPKGAFIRRYVPELAALPDAALHAPWEARPVDLTAAGFVLGRDYPRPIVNHAEARAATLARYAVVKSAAA